jgi:hypothetical protein
MQWILKIMTFNKARTITKLFVYMATLIQFILSLLRNLESTDTVDILTFNKSVTIRKLFCIMATLIQFILAFQQNLEGIDTVDIENIGVQ